MKRLPILLLTLVSLFILSCESSDVAPEITPETPKIVDDYKLLSINSEGKIFEIGNNTGETTVIGQIENSSKLIQLAAICNTDSKIYVTEASFFPAPNILTIYDKLTATTATQQLILPASLVETMSQPIITNLEYNGSELIAIVSQNTIWSNNLPNHIISINLQNYQTTDLGIDLFQHSATSTELINDKLYVSTIEDGLLEVNLINKTVTELQASGAKLNGTRLCKIGNTKLGLMKFGFPEIINGVKPFEFNLINGSLSDKSPENIFALGNINGGTIFHNDEYLNLVYRTDHKYGIQKINYETNSIKFVELDKDLLGANAIIVDIIE